MNWILQNAIAAPPSVDRGRCRFALGLVDPLAEILLFLVLARRERRLVGLAVETHLAVAAQRPGRPLLPRHEMAQDLLGDQEAVLELGDRIGRCLEHDDVVRALAITVDLVREPPAAPGCDLDDLAARADDLARRAVDDRLGALIGRIRPEDEHEFVTAHWPRTPSCGGAP